MRSSIRRRPRDRHPVGIHDHALALERDAAFGARPIRTREEQPILVRVGDRLVDPHGPAGGTGPFDGSRDPVRRDRNEVDARAGLGDRQFREPEVVADLDADPTERRVDRHDLVSGFEPPLLLVPQVELPITGFESVGRDDQRAVVDRAFPGFRESADDPRVSLGGNPFPRPGGVAVSGLGHRFEFVGRLEDVPGRGQFGEDDEICVVVLANGRDRLRPVSFDGAELGDRLDDGDGDLGTVERL